MSHRTCGRGIELAAIVVLVSLGLDGAGEVRRIDAAATQGAGIEPRRACAEHHPSPGDTHVRKVPDRLREVRIRGGIQRVELIPTSCRPCRRELHRRDLDGVRDSLGRVNEIEVADTLRAAGIPVDDRSTKQVLKDALRLSFELVLDASHGTDGPTGAGRVPRPI